MRKDLRKWRKDSDNFIGSSKDRDNLFKELEKQKCQKHGGISQ